MHHLRADALIHLYGLRWLGGDDIVERRLLGALVLTLLELRNFDRLFKNKATVDVTGYVFLYSFNIPYRNSGGYVWVIYTYRRGVCVARFEQSGNAKTLKE